MKFCEILFWLSIFIVFYTYIGYGILLYVLVKIKECFYPLIQHTIPTDIDLPKLTLFIAA